jgi:hypothetical protein
MAATSFMGAGVKLAIQMLDGLIKEFLPSGKKRNALLDAIRDLNKSIKFDTKYIDIVTRRFDEGSPPPTFAAAGVENPFGFTVPAPVTGSSAPAFKFENPFGLTIPAFATGGIVTGPTLGLIGEAGPEAVIPLKRAGGMGTTINLTVNAGMGADGTQVGEQIVSALRQYQRRNGALPLTVA